MAIFDTTRSNYGSARPANQFSGLFGTLVGSVVAWNDARTTRGSLSRLTDRELDDIGLSRADIDRVADGSLTR